jgi:hypothetical protein
LVNRDEITDPVIRRDTRALVSGLVADQGGAGEITAARAVLIKGIARCNAAADLLIRDLEQNGLFRDEDGRRVASPALVQLARFVGEARQGALALGLDRRAAKAVSLADYIARRAELPKDAAIPAEIVSEAEREAATEPQP